MFHKLMVGANYAEIKLIDIPIVELGLSEAAAEMTSRGLGDSELLRYAHDSRTGEFSAEYRLEVEGWWF